MLTAERSRPHAAGYIKRSRRGNLTAYTYCLHLLLAAVFIMRKTLTTLSLIGLLLSVGLWGASYLFSMRTRFNVGGESVSLLTYEGGVHWRVADRPTNRRGVVWKWGRTPRPGYVARVPTYYDAGDFWLYNLPFWTPTILFGTTTALLFTPHLPLLRRRKRKKLGLCVKCGYDLRGSKGRCPECGDEFDTT